ncbi:MAG: peptide chain release factor 2 [Acidimicrobiales bacterium]|nr:peptide chain release factor 2 [Acidimicrobiales bacterium]
MRDHTDAFGELRKRLAEAERYLAIDELRARRPQLETEMGRPDLWDDADVARKVQTELAAVMDDLDSYDGLLRRVEDIETLYELGQEEGDDSVEPEIEAGVAHVRTRLDELERRSLFTEPYDEYDAVCELHSGAGGTDAQDWAEMLLRMYRRWAENNGFTLEVESVSEGQEAGLLSAEFLVKGRYAFGMLKAERGTHRLVRISPFDNNARRQTAFAGLTVVPLIEDDAEISIDEKDLRVDVYRSSGAGGQHINTTDSAVRITHLPTGVVVSCQVERSQIQNRERAMQALRAKLADRQRQERDEKIAALAGEKKKVEWGSQIRSYVLQPYQMVKDERSGHQTSSVDAVLDGDVQPFIDAYLQWVRAESLTS